MCIPACTAVLYANTGTVTRLLNLLQCSHAAPVPVYYIIACAQSMGLPPTGWAGGGSFHSSSIYTATCLKRDVWRENVVYNQTTRWQRCLYLVYKQKTRGQRCLYWKTAPYAPVRLNYGSCPRFDLPPKRSMLPLTRCAI